MRTKAMCYTVKKSFLSNVTLFYFAVQTRKTKQNNNNNNKKPIRKKFRLIVSIFPVFAVIISKQGLL